MARRIMMTKFFKRAEYHDFSDDGNYFRMYVLETPNGDMEVSYLKADGEVYISPRGYALKGDMTYDELKASCPSYKDLDIYNGVSENLVDLERLSAIMYKFIEEVSVARRNVKPVDRTLVEEYTHRYNAKLAEVQNQVRAVLNIDYLAGISESYQRNELLNEYRSLMNNKPIDTEYLMRNYNRAYLIDTISREPQIYTGYYINKFIFKKY